MSTTYYKEATGSYANMSMRLSMTQTPNASANTSTIAYTLYLYKTNAAGGYAFNYGNSVQFSLGGVGILNTSNIGSIINTGQPQGWTYILATGTTTVQHGSDGTKSIAVYARFCQTQSTNATYTINETWTLDPLYRVSTMTFDFASKDVGGTLSISISRDKSTYTHDLSYSFDNSTWTALSTGVATSYSWSIPASMANSITSSASATCYVKCVTYDSGTELGSSVSTFLMTIPNTSAYNPSISCTVTNSISSIYNAWVRNLSKATVSVTPTIAYSANITACAITIGGGSYNPEIASTMSASRMITDASTSVTVLVTDSRGRTASYTTTISASDSYAAPTYTISLKRCLSDGTLSETGDFGKISVAATYTLLGTANTLTQTSYYKKSSDTSYTTAGTSSDTGHEGVLAATYVVAMSSAYAWIAKITIADAFQTVEPTAAISEVAAPLDLKSGGDGVAFGKIATESDAVDSAWKIKARNGLDVYDDKITFYNAGGTAIGTVGPSSSASIVSASAYVSGAADWHDSGAYLDLSAGTYVIRAASMNRYANQSSVFGVQLRYTDSQTTYKRETLLYNGGSTVTGENAQIEVTWLLALSSAYRIYVFEKSGSGLSLFVTVEAAKIG